MAVEALALQATIGQATQMAGVQRQAEAASETFASHVRRQFAARVIERTETVAVITNVRPNGERSQNPRRRPYAPRTVRARRQAPPNAKPLIDVSA